MLSQRFEQLLKALTDACDMVIIDSPPMQLFSDALVLANMVNGVVFVVKAGSTAHHLARHSLGALRSVNAKVFGVILNQLDFREAERYYGAYTGAYDDYYRKASRLSAVGRRLVPPPGESRIVPVSNMD
jgi:Mrp family chromosome partitioning ATPase